MMWIWRLFWCFCTWHRFCAFFKEMQNRQRWLQTCQPSFKVTKIQFLLKSASLNKCKSSIGSPQRNLPKWISQTHLPRQISPNRSLKTDLLKRISPNGSFQVDLFQWISLNGSPQTNLTICTPKQNSKQPLIRPCNRNQTIPINCKQNLTFGFRKKVLLYPSASLYTPARTHFISGLKSRVLKSTFLK